MKAANPATESAMKPIDLPGGTREDLVHRLQQTLSAKGIAVTAKLVRFEEPLDRKRVATMPSKLPRSRATAPSSWGGTRLRD